MKRRVFKKKEEGNIFWSNIIHRHFSGLKPKLLKSRSKYTPEQYFKRGLIFAAQIAIFITLVVWIVIRQSDGDPKFILYSFLIFYPLSFWFHYKMPDITAMRLRRQIDKQLLYLTRHIIIAIQSGETLVNTISKVGTISYGTAGIMFREIADDIKLGTNIELAVDRGIERSPSENLSKILVEIQNSLRIGTDISLAMNRFIKSLTQEGEIEIKRYSKEMNSLTLFYLVLGIVMPSIGIAMATVLSSMVNLQIGFRDLVIVAFFIMILQGIFLSLYKSLRSSVII